MIPVKIFFYTQKNNTTPFITSIDQLQVREKYSYLMQLLRLRLNDMSKCTKVKQAQGVYQCTLHTDLQTASYLYFTKLTGNKQDNHIVILTTGTGESTLTDIERAQIYLSEYTKSPTDRTRDYHEYIDELISNAKNTAQYLNTALLSEYEDVLTLALRDILHARKNIIGQLSDESASYIQELYTMFSANNKIKLNALLPFKHICTILNALGLIISVKTTQ
ncbi:hypothetical protein KG892_05160 [Vermiphilus pyriformis]|nr:MAG: hypothetical protein KG892_05160 [Vermiphilus pyriformis]